MGKIGPGVKNINPINTSRLKDAHHSSLARKWLTFWQNPNDEFALDELGIEIDNILRTLLPRGKTAGTLLSNWEEDIRQEAGILLYRRFLVGNEELIAATQNNNHGAISEHLKRSVWAALKSTIWPLRRKILQWEEVFESRENLEELGGTTNPHPSELQQIGDLPIEVQLELVRSALQRASREKRLSTQSVEIARSLLDGDLTQAEIARARGVSRQAINQRLAPVRNYLRNAIQTEEFPMS